MRRAWTALGIVVLAVVMIAAPVNAQAPPASRPYPLTLFEHIYSLILEDALAPPDYQVLLRAMFDGMRTYLRSQVVATPLPDLEYTGSERADRSSALGRMEGALSMAPAGSGPLDLVYAGLRAMVEAVGEPNSVFLVPTQMSRFNAGQSPAFIGIGVQLAPYGGRALIVCVLDDSPAARAGVQSEDVIVAVNGEATEGKPLPEVQELMRGEEGSTLRLGVFRQSTGETLTVELIRSRIRQSSACGRMIAPSIGYLRLSEFRTGAAAEVGSLLRRLRAEGARGLVLDLRGNPGGLLTESIEVASYFLKEGLVLTVQGRGSRTVAYLVRPREPKFTEGVVVLVNRGSASAAEIVAGAMQDAGVKLVGETTYGKATVQAVHQFSDGSGLRLTVARYLTRSGRDIANGGLSPDLAVALGSGVMGTPDDEQLKRAVVVAGDLIRTTAQGSRPGAPIVLAAAR